VVAGLARVEERLWPLLERFLATHDAAGLAVAVVCEGEVVARGFGVRDVRTGAVVTPETMFHLASVSKPFVATAVVSLALAGDTDAPVLDLDAPVVDLLPELTLADGRERELTARGLLSHASGLPDVSAYGWHDPQLGDDALSDFARSLSHWRLRTDPGSAHSYSNAGYELLGLLLARVVGSTFEDAVRQQVLLPTGMRRSTFRRDEVPADLAASPHVGMPLTVPGDSYPYTRRHAPSSTLHSNLVELCLWMEALLEPGRLDPALLDLMWRPAVPVGEPPWEEAAGLGWAVGHHHGHRVLSHSGMDPGFGARLALVPGRRVGVVVLANSNTVPVSGIARAALDLVLDEPGLDCVTDLGVLLPPVVGPVARALAASGPEAAEAVLQRASVTTPAEHDLDDEVFVDAVWGAIELHRTDLVWPLLRLWARLRPASSSAWAMTGWAHQVDGEPEPARRHLERALELDPGNEEAAQLLGDLQSP
jgi:CubicO group peptidase (beta-lactamase class C family)